MQMARACTRAHVQHACIQRAHNMQMCATKHALAGTGKDADRLHAHTQTSAARIYAEHTSMHTPAPLPQAIDVHPSLSTPPCGQAKLTGMKRASRAGLQFILLKHEQ